MGAGRGGNRVGTYGFVKPRRDDRTGVTTQTTDHGSKSKNLKNPTVDNVPSFPGDFELLKLTITSPNRKGYLDLKGAWQDLNIYEDLFVNCLTGNITLVEGIGLRESFPIVGEETVHMHLRTKGIKRERENKTLTGPFKDSENEGIINLSFRVYKISDITKENDTLVSYTLQLISEEYIINLKSKVQKVCRDPGTLEPIRISTMVNSLYKQFFKRGRPKAKKIFVEPTKNPTDLVIPNYPPFKAFNFLASRAVSAGQHAAGSSFVFYETIKGFFFVSMETLMSGGGTGYQVEATKDSSPTEVVYTTPENPVKETYVVQPKQMRAKKVTPQNVAIEMLAVDEYSFSSNFDVIQNLTKGMYSNRLLTHDIVRMKYDTLDFNYVNPEDMKTKSEDIDGSVDGVEITEFSKAAADAKNFHDTFTHLGNGKLCSEKQFAMGSPEAVISFFPTNFGHDTAFKDDIGVQGVKGEVKGPLNIIPNRVEQWLQSRLVQSQQRNNIKLNVRAPGMSTRTVGDLIEFKLPTTFIEDRGGETPSTHHRYLSGYYLITKLRHHFTKEKYNIEFEAIKDSLNSGVGKNTTEAGSGG